MGEKTAPYGSVEWFVSEYARVVDDPWGLSWRPSQKLRYVHTLELLDKIDRPIKSILDIGCAIGDITFLLSKKYPHASVKGMDFTESAIRRAQEKYPNLDFRIGSIFDAGQQFNGTIDLALCLEVLYYIDSAEHLRAMDSVKSALSPGGYALFSSFRGEPPYLSKDDLLNLASQRFEVVDDVTVYVTPLSMVERVGMKIDKLGPRIGLPWISSVVRKSAAGFPIGLAGRIERVGRRWLPDLAASHSLVLARKM
jgi:2-polyprenyl-3-methyl-5-hydroxy-6-metoxy-1,4-benzoquinol methylase